MRKFGDSNEFIKAKETDFWSPNHLHAKIANFDHV